MEVTGLTYTYPAADAPALSDVSLRVEPGTMCAVVGANGAGKTTLCHAVRGFAPHFYNGELTGSVRVGDVDVVSADEDVLARHVGYLFQNPFTQMSGITDTVFDELAFGLGNLGVPPPEIRDRVREMLERAGLAALARKHPFALSGGQQQRVALAAVLLMDQPVLVVDEPTSQLDPAATEEVLALLARARDDGRTVLLVEHKAGLVARHADQVAVLDGGTVALAGAPAEVFTDPRTTARGADLPPATRLAADLRERGVEVGPRLDVAALAAALAPAAAPSARQGAPQQVRHTQVRPSLRASSGPAGTTPDARPRPVDQPLVELRDVTYVYPDGTRAVDGVSLTVAAGESVAIVGRNGAGKTTTVKMMNALVRPASGTVRVAGGETSHRTTAQVSRVVGYVFQNPDDQIFHSTVRAEVEYGLRRLRIAPEERADRVATAAELTGLRDVLGENPHDLPLSVRKFVTIAACIAVDPRVVVLDEPTAGQDRAGMQRLGELLRQLTGRGRAVATITHDMEFAARHADRVVVMTGGRVAADGPTDRVVTDPAVMSEARLARPVVAELADRLGLPDVGLDLDRLAAHLRGGDAPATGTG
ncbi:ABC transporter ATP-binding protein [Georgenia alba]|uniref:ABC transporter ATP-binding protein n=1 Tax=Georgenia alba TaxID=2233858 RepID=A0ABW2QBX9_9MICO